MSVTIGNKFIEPLCYLAMIGLSVVSHLNENLLPLHI